MLTHFRRRRSGGGRGHRSRRSRPRRTRQSVRLVRRGRCPLPSSAGVNAGAMHHRAERSSTIAGRRAFAASGLLLGLLVARPGVAAEESNKVAARALGTDGVEAYQAGDYERATRQLEAAYAVLRVPSLGLWSARALAKLGKLVEASDRYLEASQLPASSGSAEDVQQRAKQDAAVERIDLLERVPQLTVAVRGVATTDVNCTLRGASLPAAALGKATPANPGPAEVACRFRDQEQKRELVLGEGAHETASFTFASSGGPAAGARGDAALPPDVGSHGQTQRWLGWSAVGVGAAGVVVGSVLGIMAIQKKSDFDCTGSVCRESAATLQSYNELRVPSAVALIAGGVLSATGVVLLVTAPKPSGERQLGIYLSPTQVGLASRF
jgi:hypothetical protein